LAKCILRGWFNSAEEGSTVDLSETGYMNNQMTCDGFKIFISGHIGRLVVKDMDLI
jgi:hypothetical protein